MIENRPGSKIFWKFWAQWMIANGFSWFIGMSLAWLLSTLVEPLTNGIGFTIFWLVAGMGVGAGFATNHWILFRPITHKFPPNGVGRWVVATILAWGIGLSLISGAGLASNSGFTISGMTIGILVGLAQWFVIRSRITKSWLWIIAQTLAWTVAISLIQTSAQTIGFVIAGMVSGLLSGGVLSYLFNFSDSPAAA